MDNSQIEYSVFGMFHEACENCKMGFQTPDASTSQSHNFIGIERKTLLQTEQSLA